SRRSWSARCELRVRASRRPTPTTSDGKSPRFLKELPSPPRPAAIVREEAENRAPRPSPPLPAAALPRRRRRCWLAAVGLGQPPPAWLPTRLWRRSFCRENAGDVLVAVGSGVAHPVLALGGATGRPPLPAPSPG
ncbi:unnamed protein product, partial [Ectocarpus sp. 8 AP-2014]